MVLHVYSEQCNTPAVELILGQTWKIPLEIDARREEDQSTPLLLCVQSGIAAGTDFLQNCLDTITLLLKAKADPLLTNANDVSPLSEAVKMRQVAIANGDTEQSEKILQIINCLKSHSARHEKANLELLAAASVNDTPTVLALIAKGVSANGWTDDGNHSPLMVAIQKGCVESAMALADEVISRTDVFLSPLFLHFYFKAEENPFLPWARHSTVSSFVSFFVSGQRRCLCDR